MRIMSEYTGSILLVLSILAPGSFAVEVSLTQKDIQQKVEYYSTENNDTGILLLTETKGHVVKAVAGLADRENGRPITADDLFEIGSASKVFTAIAIFQLIESGKLSLETSLGKLYPQGRIRALANYRGKNYWNDVTVGMLLNHTSGFIDYLNVYGDDDKAIAIFDDPKRHYDFDTIIGLALQYGDANFKPGTQFKYCNTGYIILGDIIEKVSGTPWRDYIRKHIFDRAAVMHTWFGTRIPKPLRQNMPKGYNHFHPSHMPMSLADSAGEVISTLDDLKTLIDLWSNGGFYDKTKTLQLQRTEGFHTMSPTTPDLQYGYGIMRVHGFYGHGGQTFGFQSYMAVNPEANTTYIVGTNDARVMSMAVWMQMEGMDFRKIVGLEQP